MKKAKRIRLIIIAAIVLILAGFVAYFYFNFYAYKGYKKYLTKDVAYEKGTKFNQLQDSDPKVSGMVLAAENDYLKLYTNTKTTEIAVYDKRSGEITYSNPVDRDKDTLATGSNKVDLNSQFSLTYYDIKMAQATMYNYDYSVERKQYKAEKLKDGLRYTYLCGNMDSPTGLVPPYITQKRLEEIINKITSRMDKNKIKNSYVASSSLNGFLELTAGAKSSKIGLSKMGSILEEVGYTQKDFEADQAAAAGGKTPEKTTFTIPLEYRLVKDKLVVSIPMKHVKETGSGYLGYINLLPYMGAGSSKENGYMFVPNGSGSLINFNNGKQTSERYNQYIYGMDETAMSYTQLDDTEKARMPVFGIKHENNAIFAEITKGDSFANLIAEVSGTTNTYNNVFPSFELRGALKVSVLGITGASSDMPTLEKKLYDSDIEVSYAFLEKKDASYSGMANYYRNDLIDSGKLTQKNKEDSIPFYLDIVGGVKMKQSFLGQHYNKEYAMTTFDEAGKITDGFTDNNINNLRVNYLGWFNGGYYNSPVKSVKVDSVLGGRKDLKALNNKLIEKGAKLYGDAAIQKVSYTAKHFNGNFEAAKRYSGDPVVYGEYNPIYLNTDSALGGYVERIYYIISPKFLGRYVSKFAKAVEKIDISGLSLRDLGDTLTADKRRTEIINREKAKQIAEAQLKTLKESKKNLMINGGNAYSWAYATDLTNIPKSDNKFYLVDEEVPFYQMVIHGSIDYTAEAINLSDTYDKQDVILRMIEFGEAPHFTLSYKESSKIKYSGLNTLYSTQYTTWMKDAIDIYKKTNDALKYVVNSTIVDHTILDNGIRKVTYDNGAIFYINTSNKDASAENVTIPAKSYVIEGVK